MIQTYTEEYNAMCPHTRMCNVLIDYNSTLLLVEDIKRFPCCGSCLQNCHNDCLKTLDCCIDALPRLLTTDEVRNVHEKPTKCVLPQYRPIHKSRVNNNEAYLMMTRCSPSYEDKTVRDKCLKEYSDFDFEKDIPSFLPVTDNTTKISYKNKYCAMCNWASSSNLVFWKVVLGSTGQVFETNQFQSMSDITLLFTQDSTSNALFKVPDSLKEDESSVVYCDFYIDECNVTGLWKEYNADIEALCLSYLSKYEDYKNVHCYLCNSLEDPYIPELCEESLISPPPSSFIALLDFNNLEKPEGENPEQEIQCTDDHMYDPWTVSLTSILSICFDALHLSQKIFSHAGTIKKISVFLG